MLYSRLCKGVEEGDDLVGLTMMKNVNIPDPSSHPNWPHPFRNVGKSKITAVEIQLTAPVTTLVVFLNLN